MMRIDIFAMGLKHNNSCLLLLDSTHAFYQAEKSHVNRLINKKIKNLTSQGDVGLNFVTKERSMSSSRLQKAVQSTDCRTSYL